ncbi:MAG: TRZ/ATZ family hydrolase [Gammaproteobacteria bacterium]|nr:MAG: TRZ/ATZ family hydrolase [Gammaproteobacteria bacterium]
MKSIDLLLSARWIITVNPENAVLDHHAVAIDNGRILDILPDVEAERQYRADRRHDFDQHALIPGLINTHTHVAMSLFRGLADDLPLMEWLEQHIWPAEGRWVKEGFVKTGTELAIAEMLRGGTTCFNDMYFFPDVTAKVADLAGIRATVGMILIDFPTVWAKDADEYLKKGLAVNDNYRNHERIRTAFAPHAPYTVSDTPLERVQMLAEELDCRIHMHIHETAFEVESFHKETGIRPLQRLEKLGLLGPRLLAVHMTQLTDGEIQTLARNGVSVVHCPESNLKLASGFCPTAALSRAEVNIALGTDGAASNNDLDMLGEMRTAALIAKAHSQDASALPAAEALRMATINGARALGIDDETGSLEIGKAADIAAIDLSRLETQPIYDPVSAIVYAASREQITDVWVAGEPLLKNRELTRMDIAQLQSEAQSWQHRIAP